ncbi:hypothetical protein AAMO2058_001317000 [Amorphochlora amoebiformis]
MDSDYNVDAKRDLSPPPNSSEEFKDLLLQAQEVRSEIKRVEKKMSPQQVTLETLDELLKKGEIFSRRNYTKLGTFVQVLLGLDPFPHLIKDFYESGLERIYRTQAALNGWADVMERLSELRALYDNVEDQVTGFYTMEERLTNMWRPRLFAICACILVAIVLRFWLVIALKLIIASVTVYQLNLEKKLSSPSFLIVTAIFIFWSLV